MAIIHSKRAGIILEGISLQKWIEGGERKKKKKRKVAVKIEEARFISVTSPVGEKKWRDAKPRWALN